MKNELNKNIDCLITKSIIVKKILAFHQHMNTYKPKFWRWFAVVCGGLRWFSRFFNGTRSYRRIIVPNSGGGLWWFAVVCGGLWWIAVVCLLVIPSAYDFKNFFIRNKNVVFLCVNIILLIFFCKG